MKEGDSLKIEFTPGKEYLTVIGFGIGNSFKSLVEVTRRIYEKVAETKVKFMLLDFQQAQLKMDWSDSFNLVRMYEKSMPEFFHISAACTFNPESGKFVHYWHEICIKRGFDAHVFPSRAEAEKWLLEKIYQYNFNLR